MTACMQTIQEKEKKTVLQFSHANRNRIRKLMDLSIEPPSPFLYTPISKWTQQSSPHDNQNLACPTTKERTKMQQEFLCNFAPFAAKLQLIRTQPICSKKSYYFCLKTLSYNIQEIIPILSQTLSSSWVYNVDTQRQLGTNICGWKKHSHKQPSETVINLVTDFNTNRSEPGEPKQK